MLPKTHFIIGLIASLFIFLFFPNVNLLYLTIFFLASFLIDFDHYIYFVYKKKSFDLKKAYFWFRSKGRFLKNIPREKRKKYSTGIYIFHGLEALLIAFLFGLLVHQIFYAVFLGMFLHMIFDWTEKIWNSKTYPKKFSVIYDIFMHKKLKSLD